MSKPSPTIDWNAARLRIHESQLAMERSLQLGTDELEEIFRRRAFRLAGRAGEVSAPDNTLEALVFFAGTGRYGVELRRLTGVMACPAMTRVPGAPAEIRGVFNDRGFITSVWDLPRLLSQTSNDGVSDAAPAYVLRIRSVQRDVLLLVTNIDKIVALPAGSLTQRGAEQDAGRGPYVSQWMADDFAMLNIDALLSHLFDPQKAAL